ncbi:MAG: major capsid protein [Peptostreptococcaceae bacterium]|nr:major capsid protein [Peptostreptococcaceae bacterium]
MNFEELFGYSVIRDYLKERQFKPFLGELLFPEDKIQDIDLAYIKGANRLPVSASVHGFDTETEIASREAQEIVKERLALIKRRIKMGEELLIKLNTPRTQKEFEKAKEQVFNDVDQMVMAVRARIEAMRMEALTSGKLAVNENGVTVSLDYKMPTENIKTLGGTSVWTDAQADPIANMIQWRDDLKGRTGSDPVRALTSNAVLAAILSHAKVKKAVYGGNFEKLLTKKELNAFLESLDLPEIATYDERYKVQNANGTYTTKRFFDENKFVMMPAGTLGETIYGLTPEEIELSGKSGNEIHEENKITVQVYRTNDPVARWTKAVATALPSFPAAGEVLVAKVK